MASTRHVAGSVPVGSLAWVANERATIEQLEAQELEEFAFAARNDLEWLNEHMADIFERNTLYATHRDLPPTWDLVNTRIVIWQS